jgi:hypothetical protein
MTRPKSDNFVGFKVPTELKEDALELAALGGKTEAEAWKEAMEFRLGFVRMVRIGYWDLRTMPIACEVQPGLTNAVKV